MVASYVYEGFGKIVGQNGSGSGPYRFCGLWGYRDDGDAGLMHVGARYYEVETGRWVQKDLMLYKIINYSNLYTYCLNNPVNDFDVNGLISWRKVIFYLLCLITGEKPPERPLPPPAQMDPIVGEPPPGWKLEPPTTVGGRPVVFRPPNVERGYGSGGGLGAIGTIVVGAGVLADGLRAVIRYRKRIEKYLDPEGDWN